MTGRGKPPKAISPKTEGAESKTRPKEVKQVCKSKCPDFTEEKQIETTNKQKPKKREQKQPNHTEKKLSAPGTRKKEANHFTGENSEQQRTPPGQGTTAKTCAARTKTGEQSAKEMTTIQPDIPEDTTKNSPKTTKATKCSGIAKSPKQSAEKMTPQPDTLKGTAKTCGGKAKSKDKFAEEMTCVLPETPKYTTKAPRENTKGKACGNEAKQAIFAEDTTETQPEQFKEMKTQPQTPKKTTKAKTYAGKVKSEETTTIQPEDSTKSRLAERAPVDKVLNDTLKKLKIKMHDKSNTAKIINNITDKIVKHLKQKTQYFKEVEEPLRTGSYYENLKIYHPDEFDVMMPIPVDRVDIEPFGNDGAFYSVGLKRGSHPLKQFQEDSTLSGSNLLEEFRKEVMKSVKEFKEWQVTRKKKGCPAVTLTTEVQSVTISLDIVLSLLVKSSWPRFTKEGMNVEGWLGRKVKQELKQKPYYLVPKYEGFGNVEIEGVLAKDVWRISFSHVEKHILKNHGSQKTCCEKDGTSCCRKDCLKLLKYLLSLLKENNPKFQKFCSYHAKTTLLHACCSRTTDSDWKTTDLNHCFQLLLQDFEGYLRNGHLKNFFIPDQNLLSGPGKMCTTLADCIKEERDNGFPLFKQQLTH
ncbi:cyclic GMP-AMP synthase [Brachyistius frenatus]|uniref:cyclic GMP-AMP synthase n=1 Tax=Brachyistius frenatus TaxID=100188 RepID=UPI0037E779BA